MRIHGLQKLTLLDYPGKTACTIFLSGCNFRCPFCHNTPLLTADAADGMDEEELLAFLKNGRGFSTVLPLPAESRFCARTCRSCWKRSRHWGM